MRILASLLLCLLVSAGFAATTIDVSLVNSNTATTSFSLTSTEAPITFTKNDDGRSVVVVVTVDQAWGWSSATGAFGTKFPLVAGQSWTFKMTEASKTYYLQASSTTGTLHVYVLDSVPMP